LRAPIAIAVLLAISAFQAAAEDEWVTIATPDDRASDDKTWQVKRGSLGYRMTRNLDAVVYVKGRLVDPASQKKEQLIWYVAKEHCVADRGILVTTDMKGEYLYREDYIDTGRSAPSRMANYICVAALDDYDTGEGRSLK